MKVYLELLQATIKAAYGNGIQLMKCQTELAEQGVLDVLCRCVEVMYWKMSPPCLFCKPFA